MRHPLVYLMEAADDICYEIMDIEDSHKLKILSFDETKNLLLSFFDNDTQEEIIRRLKEEGVTDENEQVVYLRACVVGKLENECVQTFVDHEDEILNGTFKGTLIGNKPVLDIELSGYKIMETLMQSLISAVVQPDRFHSKQIIERVSSQYDIHSDDLETRIMAVLDYISGMTDVYALDVYQKLCGISLPIV